jgi:hypothetical protein
MIAFYEGTTNKLIGVAKEVDGEYVSDTPTVANMISHYGDKERFQQRFSNWSNGYLYSVELEEGENPESPSFLEQTAEPKTWTAEEIRAAREGQSDAPKS